MSRLACFFAQPHLASPRQEAKTPKCFGSVPLAVVVVPATLMRSGPCPARLRRRDRQRPPLAQSDGMRRTIAQRRTKRHHAKSHFSPIMMVGKLASSRGPSRRPGFLVVEGRPRRNPGYSREPSLAMALQIACCGRLRSPVSVKLQPESNLFEFHLIRFGIAPPVLPA